MLDLSHKKLEVYKLSMCLVKDIYELTESFPKHELYSLVNQTRRAAISVSSNIAEGASRTSPKEKKRYYEIARSPVAEIDTQIEIAIHLKYYTPKSAIQLEDTIVSIFRILSKMISNLNTTIQKI